MTQRLNKENRIAVQEYKERNKVKGIISVKVRVPEKYKDDIFKYAEKLRLKG